MNRFRIFASLFFCVFAAFAADREVAITIDDLPRGGDGGPRTLAGVLAMTDRLLKPFHDGHVPVIGFVNEGRDVDFGVDGLRQVLEHWLDAGANLGNHSYSHLNINKVPLAQYEDDILKGEPAVRAALSARGRKLVYYRHPFLFTGPTPEIKRDLQTFLDQHNYRVAPVTLDDADYMFAAVYNQPGLKPLERKRVGRLYISYMESIVDFFEKRSVEVVGREFPQTLLIHANQLNADTMPQLLDMFRRRGYKFVTLDKALADPAYQLREEYVGPGGFSWIHRWSKTKGMPPKGEADPPKEVQDSYALISR